MSDASGPTPAGSPVTHAPVGVGGKALASGLPTALDDGDVSHILTDAYGRLRLRLENADGSAWSAGVDVSGTPSAGNYARWADADTLEARTTAQVLSDISAAPTASPTFTGTPSAPSLTIAGTAAPPAGTVRAIASDGNANDLSYNALAWHTFKIGGVYKVELSTAYVRLTDNAIIMAGSPAFPGGGHRAIHGGGGTTEFHYNVPTGGNHIFEVNGTEVAALGADVDLKPNGTSRLKLNSDGTVTVNATTLASLRDQVIRTGYYAVAWTATPASGYLNADGSAVSRATYAALFAVIGTTFGVGDGSTTFNLPDASGLNANDIYLHIKT